MRKQDRVAAEKQQNRTGEQPDNNARPEPREREPVQGSASPDEPARPPRERGKLPIPD